ncbi:MAG: isoprenoid biosynthesis glyoxalase ElbB [Bacteroidales bacterium]|jgi:enhancing lycopene biosynthesis protein 2|nr:isoprenoid biosynthesis glyoxalase ElbB [Bacteroidales bacterium]
MKRFAVVLAGCGHKDGAEINEAVSLLLSISQHHCEYQCFAPDRPQAEVIDHVTGNKVANAKRNIMTEAARIARGNILPIDQFKAEDYDALFFPGGFGAAKNLCDYAFKGVAMEVQPDVARVILEMHEAKKPIGAMCIAPVMLARLIPDVCVTLGAEGTDVADHVREWGANHVQTEHGDVCADNEQLVFTTPAFMLDATLKDVYDGAYNLVDAVVETLEGER